MSQIGISYTPSGGSPVYNFVFSEFLDAEFPRAYQTNATFSQSANGSSILTGAPFRQKFIWAVSAPMLTSEATSFDEMFRAWDLDRSSGLAAAVGITDQTFGADVDTSAIFSTPPVFAWMSPVLTRVSFGLTEV